MLGLRIFGWLLFALFKAIVCENECRKRRGYVKNRRDIELDEVPKDVKKSHALQVLSKLEKLRENDFFSDFEIRVGGESYPVHRTVIAACSDYFRAALSYDTKEVQCGFIDMKGVGKEAVKKCVDFMYSGEVILTVDEAADIIHASELMQIPELTGICFKFLNDNLTPKNCLDVKALADTFNCSDVSWAAMIYSVDNFAEFSRTPCFLELSKERVREYFVGYRRCINYRDLWNALIPWVERDTNDRLKYLTELFQSLGLEEFSFEFLFSIVRAEKLIRKNRECRALLVDSLFNDLERLKENLTLDNSFPLKNMSRWSKHESGPQVSEVIDSYWMEHFDELAVDERFKSLHADDVTSLFVSDHLECSSEVVKWKGLLSWTAHGKGREATFTRLLRSLKFQNFSTEFIQETIRSENLVKESHECKDLVLDILYKRAKREDDFSSPTQFAVLDVGKHHLCVFDIELCSFTRRPIAVSPSKFNGLVSLRGELFYVSDRAILRLEGECLKHSMGLVYEPSRTAKAVAFRNKVYVVGYFSMQCYDPYGKSSKTQLRGCGVDDLVTCVSTKDLIFAIGEDEIVKYDPRKGWIHVSEVIVSSHAAAAVLDGVLYIIGGFGARQLPDSVTAYYPSTNAFVHISALSMRKINPSVCVANGKLHVFGGKATPSYEIYDGETDTWEIRSKRLDNMPQKAVVRAFKRKKS